MDVAQIDDRTPLRTQAGCGCAADEKRGLEIAIDERGPGLFVGVLKGCSEKAGSVVDDAIESPLPRCGLLD